MAKVTIPEREVEVCDCCGRDGWLDDCKACGGKYCVICNGTVPGCIHRMDICKKCVANEEVRRISEKYAPLINEVLAKRDEELLAIKENRA